MRFDASTRGMIGNAIFDRLSGRKEEFKKKEFSPPGADRPRQGLKAWILRLPVAGKKPANVFYFFICPENLPGPYRSGSPEAEWCG